METLTADWQQRAACRDLDTAQFFPARELLDPPPWLVALCGGCGLRAECLAMATECRAVGYWAATTTRQRRAATG